MAAAIEGISEAPATEPEANKLFRLTMKLKGSDLHLKVGQPPAMRLAGTLRFTQLPALTTAEMERLMYPLLTPRPRRRLPWHRLPRRVVIDPSLRLPVGARLLQSLPAPLTIAISRERVVDSSRVNELKSQGVEIIDLPALNDDIRTLDLIPLLRHLASVHGSTNVMIEGGATLLGHAFSQRVIDEALVFIAPKLAGDDGGIPVVRGLKHTMIREMSAHAPHKVKWFGDDVMLEYRIR